MKEHSHALASERKELPHQKTEDKYKQRLFISLITIFAFIGP